VELICRQHAVELQLWDLAAAAAAAVVVDVQMVVPASTAVPEAGEHRGREGRVLVAMRWSGVMKKGTCCCRPLTCEPAPWLPETRPACLYVG